MRSSWRLSDLFSSWRIRIRRVVARSSSLYAEALYLDAGATLDDLREALNTLEEIEPTARRVFGGAHPLTLAIEKYLQKTRATLREMIRILEPKK